MFPEAPWGYGCDHVSALVAQRSPLLPLTMAEKQFEWWAAQLLTADDKGAKLCLRCELAANFTTEVRSVPVT